MNGSEGLIHLCFMPSGHNSPTEYRLTFDWDRSWLRTLRDLRGACESEAAEAFDRLIAQMQPFCEPGPGP